MGYASYSNTGYASYSNTGYASYSNTGFTSYSNTGYLLTVIRVTSYNNRGMAFTEKSVLITVKSCALLNDSLLFSLLIESFYYSNMLTPPTVHYK